LKKHDNDEVLAETILGNYDVSDKVKKRIIKVTGIDYDLWWKENVLS